MRVKRGVVGRRKHGKVLKAAKGMRGRRKNVFKFAKDAVERSMQKQYIGRKHRKRDFRTLWITRISASAKANGISYSRFILGLKKAEIGLNRKSLADIAVTNPKAFGTIVSTVQAALK